MILALIDEAVTAGATEHKACEVVGLTQRTLERWRSSDIGDDERAGPHTQPHNALSPTEKALLLETVNRPEFRALSVRQIVPRLADEGRYIGSESTMYRTLRAEGQMKHRGRAKPPQPRVVDELLATTPRQVWSWDITYLPTTVRGRFFYLYMIEDIYSRKIVGAQVHPEECNELAAALAVEATKNEDIEVQDLLRLRSDNGGPMKGATMLATLERLGVMPSFSRPGVSDDNPFSEALFRTVKYCPAYPNKPFESLEQARAWVERFVAWYNGEHRHSAIRFVTPNERHDGREHDILARRHQLYEKARQARPERWSGPTRNWTPAGSVELGPGRGGRKAKEVPKG